MIIKFHMIVEAVFSLKTVCLCVSAFVCFSTLKSHFLRGNTSTGRCSLSCLDSSRLLSSPFFCLWLKCSTAAVNSPAYKWVLYTTVSGSVKDAITRMLPDSPCPCFCMILHSLYISVIREWTAVLWCVCLCNAQKTRKLYCLKKISMKEGILGVFFCFFFSNSATSIKTAWCFILLL